MPGLARAVPFGKVDRGRRRQMIVALARVSHLDAGAAKPSQHGLADRDAVGACGSLRQLAQLLGLAQWQTSRASD
eukprot:7391550-Prymnesium_polylepis.2